MSQRWEVEDHGCEYRVVDDRGNEVVTVLDRERARLIAAAPEMLAALEDLLPYLSDEQDAKDGASLNEGMASPYDASSLRARAAIAKAKGDA